MDKNTLIGLFLIGAILLTFTLFNDREEEPAETDKTAIEETQEEVSEDDSNAEVVAIENNTNEVNDSILIAQHIEDSLLTDTAYVQHVLDSLKMAKSIEKSLQKNKKLNSKYDIFSAAVKDVKKEETTIENDQLILIFSNIDGKIVSARVKGYESYENYAESPEEITPVQLFEEKNTEQYLTLVCNGLPLSTKGLIWTKAQSDDKSVTYRLETTEADKYIEYRYTLNDGSYDIDFEVEYVNLQQNIDIASVTQVWNIVGLSTEKLASDERNIATVMYRYFDKKRDYLSERSTDELALEGKTNWVGFKHKFFTSAIISNDGFQDGKLAQTQLEDEDHTLAYASSLDLPANQLVKMKFFFGPNDYEVLASYDNGMEDIINLGWGIFGWVNKWFIQPLFNMLNSWELHMGLIILLITLIVKIVITPLTFKNYKSSAKMRVLKPEIERINEKYQGQDQMMKRQQETQALYRSSGVNPLAGCIPMLVQMPILLAVFRFFPSNIHLRHESFLWADDLSSYDSILSWSGDIPLITWAYGNHVSLLTLLMAASTMVYTMMNSNNMATPSQPGMPNMKVIMYLFPIMMIFFFNNYSSGLSYYYLCGNLFNIAIMYGIKKFFIDEQKIKLKIEENKKKPVKKSKFMQRLEEVQKQQANQKKKK